MTVLPRIKPGRSDAYADSPTTRLTVPPSPASLTLPEVIVGSVVLIIAVLAWMSLLLLDNHVGTFVATCVTAVGALLIILVVALWSKPRPAIRTDPWTLVVLAVLAVIGGFLFFPGDSYGITDKDPGGYVELGASFAHHHSSTFSSDLIQHFPAIARYVDFPGIWRNADGLVYGQFYHLWPALLAMANHVGGLQLEVQVAPFVGVLSVCAFALLLRRAVPGRASLPAAAIGGLLLEVNMMEVWQAKYPSTEIFAQLIFVTMLLALCISLETGWRPAAGASGLLLGIGWLERPDMVVIVALAAGAGAVLVVLRRFNAQAWWFAGGLVVVLPHALWQAYAGAALYSSVNQVPKLKTLVVGAVALYAVAFALRALRPFSRSVVRSLSNRKHI